MTYNLDWETRDKMLFGTANKERYWFGGTDRFSKLTLQTARELINKGFMDPDDAQNSSPTAMEFIEFMEVHPEFTAHGYAVSPDRDDYRVTIEGIESLGEMDKETTIDFIDLCEFADEFSLDPPYAWWD